jgi:hypothetical protein
LEADESDIFLQAGLDSPNQVESLQQIAVLAHAVSGASRLASEAPRRRNDHLICPPGKPYRGRLTPAAASFGKLPAPF